MKRSYSSPVRDRHAEQTRRRILETARRLFVERGYVPTTIARIAAEAEVSPQTVYNSVGGKGAILLALNDLVDEVGHVVDIQEHIAQSTEPREILALAARLRRLLMEGSGDIVALLAATAPVDDDVAEAYRDGLDRSRRGIERLIDRLDRLGALRPDLDSMVLADSAYALLHHDLWTRLVHERGWTPDAFEAWCADVLSRTLLDQRP